MIIYQSSVVRQQSQRNASLHSVLQSEIVFFSQSDRNSGFKLSPLLRWRKADCLTIRTLKADTVLHTRLVSIAVLPFE